MASLISIVTGDFTNAATWAVVSTATNAMLDSEANSTASTTANVFSAVFQPGAVTVDGVAVKVAARVVSPSGTVTVGLFLNAGSTLVAETAINVSDISNTGATPTYNRGWYFFKFATPQLLAAATDYKVGLRSSVNGEVTFYRNATVGNWSRMVRTTATGAPASGDHFHVIGEHTGAGTGNSFVVTMDNTATTSFGPTVSGGPADGCSIGKRGTMNFGTGASAYYLKWKGRMGIYDGGTFTVGTAGSPINSSGSAVLEFDAVANVDTGISVENGGTFTTYGATKTNFKTLLTVSRGGFCSTNGTAITRFPGSQTFTGLTGTININGVNRTISSVTDADNLIITASAGVNTNVVWFHVGTATAITVADTTGWANNDVLAFAPTTNIFTDGEKATATTIDSGTTLTLSAALTASHFGTSPMQAEVGNLTRNVKVRGITSLLGGYLDCKVASTVTLYYSEFYQMGGAAQVGIVAATTIGAFDMQYCSRYDSTVASSVGVSITSTSGNNITLAHNVFYNIQAEWLRNVATTGVYTINDNLFIRGNGTGITLADHGITFTNNTMAGSSAGVVSMTTDTGVLGTWSGNTIHGFTGSVSGLDFQVAFTGVGSTLSSTTVWGSNANTNGQIRFRQYIDGLTIDGLTCFYADTVHIGFNVGCNNILINNFTSNGMIAAATSIGIRVGTTISTVNRISITNSDFSTVTGNKIANLYDVEINGTGGFAQVTANNVKFGASTVAKVDTGSPGSFVAVEKFNQTVATHRTYFPYGTVIYDATIFDTTPSERLTPNNATNRLQSYAFTAAVASGATCTPSIKVRESVVGDGTDYDGQRARLFVRKNVAAGIASDTLLATATIASAGAWETLSAATAAVTDDCVLEFYVDCGGSGYTAGWVNIDTGSVAVSNATAGFKYWINGGPVVDIASAQIGVGGGASSTYA